MLGLIGPLEHASFVLGSCIMAVTVPLVLPVVFGAVVWEAVDRGFHGGFVESGNELTGFLVGKVSPAVNRATQSFNSQFVKRGEDAYMMNFMFLGAVVLPLMFAACWYHTRAYGFSLALCYAYHVVRIGPYFMNFAYVYTLCHKEGHTYSGLYSKSYNQNVLFRNVFNWWIGLFFGVMPASFAFGHSINHHRYNNAYQDCVTTSDKPRDSLVNFTAYMYRFMLYATNISTVFQFCKEGNYETAWKMVFGSVYFWVWFAGVAMFDAKFAVAYLLYPLLEQNFLIGAVSWTWHAFINPDDPADEFVGATNILEGTINVLNEDAHHVHHAYPGAHWTDHPRLQSKHWEELVSRQGTIFRGTHTFEIFGLVLFGNLGGYDKLAEKFCDIKGEREGNPMNHEQKVALLKSRVRGCWWGPRSATGDYMGKAAKEGATEDDGLTDDKAQGPVVG